MIAALSAIGVVGLVAIVTVGNSGTATDSLPPSAPEPAPIAAVPATPPLQPHPTATSVSTPEPSLTTNPTVAIAAATSRATVVVPSTTRKAPALAKAMALRYPGGKALDPREVERWIVVLTNEERDGKTWGGPLANHPKLTAAAQRHSRNMAQHYRVTHRLDGTRPKTRMEAEGHFCRQTVGENVAKTTRVHQWQVQSTYGIDVNRKPVAYRETEREMADKLVQQWMSSTEGHRETILMPKLKSIGVGVHITITEKDGWARELVWATQNFSSCE